MKKVILLALLMPLPAFGQIMENFESGSLNNWVQSTEGHWIADTVSSVSGSFSLHHIFDNPDAGTDQIGIPLTKLHPSEGLTRWTFMIRHGYDPSSSNNWATFLMSDAEPATMIPGGMVSGYAIGVNLTGYDDTLRLWKIKEGALTVIVNCKVNWQTSIGMNDAVKITVERTQNGKWSVLVNHLDDSPIGAASGFDSELFNQGWFGIYYKYSSTRDRLLWLDDISIDGVFYEDNEAPEVTRCEVTGMNSMEITLNEEPDDDFMMSGNFSLNAAGNKPVNVTKKGSFKYRIEFNNRLINKTLNDLLISHLCDKSGNCKENTKIPFTPVWAEAGDVVISEIMADPLPEVSLPVKEYIEISNRTKFTFNLKKWKLVTNDRSEPIPETGILPGAYIIICSIQDTSLFSKYGKTIGLKAFPTLTDGGRIISLSDSLDNLIHGIEYSSEWYGDELKSEGGWSLEMIDLQFPFYQEDNWTASVSRKGGTPGTANSVTFTNPDNSFLGILNVFPDDSITLKVKLSETVIDFHDYTNNITVSGRLINNLYHSDLLLREFLIKINEPLIMGKLYSLSISGEIKDFAGNKIQTKSFVFGVPEPSEKGDVMFNELLFNPLPGDPDYIEFYNCSNKVIDASRLLMVSVDDNTGNTSETQFASDENRCILPASYFAITPDKKKITARYFSSDPDKIFEIHSLPSMPDNEGHLILLNRELDKIDEVLYDEKMHYSLLSGYEGVSLEKVRPQNLSTDKSNWHSASESSGWGTPGAMNSVFSEEPTVKDGLVFSSTKITPDNNGYEDFLIIDFSLSGNNNVVSVTVFDETGNYVRKLAKNILAGQKASIVWDAAADDGSLVNTGIYIILISIYDDTGKNIKWKKVCTVIR